MAAFRLKSWKVVYRLKKEEEGNVRTGCLPPYLAFTLARQSSCPFNASLHRSVYGLPRPYAPLHPYFPSPASPAAWTLLPLDSLLPFRLYATFWSFCYLWTLLPFDSAPFGLCYLLGPSATFWTLLTPFRLSLLPTFFGFWSPTGMDGYNWLLVCSR